MRIIRIPPELRRSLGGRLVQIVAHDRELCFNLDKDAFKPRENIRKTLVKAIDAYLRSAIGRRPLPRFAQELFAFQYGFGGWGGAGRGWPGPSGGFGGGFFFCICLAGGGCRARMRAGHVECRCIGGDGTMPCKRHPILE